MSTDDRALLRVRLAAEQGGPRLILATADVRAVLALIPPVPAVPAPRQAEAPAGPGVALTASVEDAKRLARAAWDSDPERVAAHGRWEDADPALTWHTVQAAGRALAALLGPDAPSAVLAEPVLPPAPEPAPVPVYVPSNADEEPPF